MINPSNPRNDKSPSSLSPNYSGSTIFFTPIPLVHCIWKGIDYLLRTHFGITEGLLSQNLVFFDPAFGNMAFPQELIHYMHKQAKSTSFCTWLENTFLPNYYGCEINEELYIRGLKELCALLFSYSSKPYMDEIEFHLKSHFYQMDTLQNTPQIPSGFMQKDSQNVLIICGNPPYAISSHSKSEWIHDLMIDYKTHLNRAGKKRILGLKGIQDDYVKFIRWAQWNLVDQHHPGICAYVVNNYFLDGDIFRGMRYSLSYAFDKLWIINLHGDPKKHRIDELPDENVFPIQTGICLLFAIKQFNSPSSSFPLQPASILYTEIRGSQESKFQFLSKSFDMLSFQPVPVTPDVDFKPPEIPTEITDEYNHFFYLPDIFQRHSIGVQSLHDTLITHPDQARLCEILHRFYDRTYQRYEIRDTKDQRWVKQDGVIYHDARDWTIDVGLHGSFKMATNHLIQWNWRGFDKWWVAYDEYLMTRGSSSYAIMQYLLPSQQNIALGVARVSRKTHGSSSVFVVDAPADSHFLEGGSGIGDYVFPLKIGNQPKSKMRSSWDPPQEASIFNFSSEFLHSLDFYYKTTPEQIFYYIYAVLWTPLYRTRYQPLLKRDFPRIPFPQTFQQFTELAFLGEKLVSIHLLRSLAFDLTRYQQSEMTDLRIVSPSYKVTNHTLYFNKKLADHGFWVRPITPAMWEFEIGGLRQLDRWLHHRIYIPPPSNPLEHHKFQFTRALNVTEFQWFLQICEAIRLTLEIQADLDKHYRRIEKSIV